MEVKITDMQFNEDGDMCINVVYKKPITNSDVKMDDFDRVVGNTHLGSAVIYQ